MSKIPASAKILFEEAAKENLNPTWETDYGLFSFKHKDKTVFVYLTKLPINNTLGNWMTQDKFAARVILEKYNLPNIPYCFSTEIKVVNKFLSEQKTIVGKPVLGEQAKNVMLITNHAQIKSLSLKDTIFEKYIEGMEFRYLVLNSEVVGAQQRDLNPSKEYPWRKRITNLEEKEYDKELVSLSLKISKIINQNFLAVDFIVDREGKTWVLELNSMPGLYSWHNPDGGKSKNIAKLIIKAII